MTIDAFERVTALAPQSPVDPDGLTRARAAFEREVAAQKHGSPAPRPGTAHRRRHARRLALAGAAALSVTAAAVILPTAHDLGGLTGGGENPSAAAPGAPLGPLTTGLLPAAAADDASCTPEVLGSETAHAVDRDLWASGPIGSVMDLVGERRPDHVWAYAADRHCPTAVAAAVVYDAATTRGVNVYRDVATDPVTAVEEVGRAREQSVRGVAGHALAWVNDDGRPRQRITWIDDDGVRWYAESDGMPVEDTVAVLDALAFDADGALLQDSTPAGFTAAPVTDPAVGEEPTYTWIAEYAGDESTFVEQDGGLLEVTSREYMYLEVTTPALEPVEARVAAFGDQVVDLDGVPAAWTEHGQGGAQLAWTAGGARYRLTAVVGSLDEMLALARTVRAVEPTDERLG